MKVLHVEAGRNLYGGALQVAYLVEGLTERGVESVVVLPEGSALAAELQGKVTRLYTIPMRGDLDPGLVFRLVRIIHLESPDIVHLHSRRGADLLGGIAARWCGVPAVLSRRVDNRENPLQVRFKYKLYQKVIAISDGIRDVLLRQGMDRSKVVCVRSAVDIERYRVACNRQWFNKEFGLSEADRVIAVAAQLIPRKGHRFLIDALSRLINEFPELRLLLLGKGPEEGRIREQVSRLGLEDCVIFAGFRNDLPRILPCLEILVHPSLKEGLGIALLQASSAGIPVVASKAGGMPEAVGDNESGLLVPPGDSNALKAAVKRLLSEPETARRLGDAGRARMAAEFSIDVMVDGNYRIYKEFLEPLPEK